MHDLLHILFDETPPFKYFEYPITALIPGLVSGGVARAGHAHRHPFLDKRKPPQIPLRHRRLRQLCEHCLRKARADGVLQKLFHPIDIDNNHIFVY